MGREAVPDLGCQRKHSLEPHHTDARNRLTLGNPKPFTFERNPSESMPLPGVGLDVELSYLSQPITSVLAAFAASIRDLRTTAGSGVVVGQQPTAPGNESQREVDGVTLVYAGIKTASSPSTEVHRTTQWVVRGHWRHQWYPASQDHKPLWISSHRAGATDGPMLRRDKVFVLTPTRR